VNHSHEETTISSNLRSKTQNLLIKQIENLTEAMKTSLVNLGDDQLPSQEATAEIDHFSNHLRLFLQVFEKVSNEFRKLGAFSRSI
jgi:chemotaxis regulatin CheY-phosphate phosphatase CheZ